MTDRRQRSLKLLARIARILPDDTEHQEAIDALTEFRAARERLERLSDNESPGGK